MRALLVLVLLACGAAHAQSVLDPLVLQRVDLVRDGATCSGTAHYQMTAKALALKADLGTVTKALPLVVPCARLDELSNASGTGFKPWPNTRAGALSFTLERVELYLDADGTTRIEATFARTPTNASLEAVYGTDRVTVAYRNNAGARITGAVVGAQVKSGIATGWPTSVVALPFPVSP